MSGNRSTSSCGRHQHIETKALQCRTTVINNRAPKRPHCRMSFISRTSIWSLREDKRSHQQMQTICCVCDLAKRDLQRTEHRPQTLQWQTKSSTLHRQRGSDGLFAATCTYVISRMLLLHPKGDKCIFSPLFSCFCTVFSLE